MRRNTLPNPFVVAGVCLMATIWTGTSPARAEPLLLCGMAEVYLIDSDEVGRGNVEKRWSWKAEGHSELPPAARSRFGTTDECKPIEDGAKVLIASSGGACALVERSSGRAIWYAQAPNAHSLELLPRDRVVVASSVGKEGNRLIVFDLGRSNEPVCQTPLASAHGVVWDPERHALWGLGLESLNRYELRDWEGPEPSLALVATYPLPSPDGHDLQAVPAGDDLIVTTHQSVYLFDRETGNFRPHPALGDRADVKSVAVQPVSGRMVYIQGEKGNWWSDRFHLLQPDAETMLKGERVYKARWLPSPPAPAGGLPPIHSAPKAPGPE